MPVLVVRHPSPRRPQDAGEDVEQRRLARSVRPGDDQDASGVEGTGELRQHGPTTKPLADPLERDANACHGGEA